jgi:phospholipase C
VYRVPRPSTLRDLATTTSLLILTACGQGSGPGPGVSSPAIEHVVIIVQENRSTDNLFHGLPGADIATSGVNSKGQTIPLTPESLANDYDLDHSHQAFLSTYDGGKMDGADKVGVVDNRYLVCPTDPELCPIPPPNAQFKYVPPSEVVPYFQLAEEYTFGDRMFQTNQGPSFPAHQFLISGTSAPTAVSDLFVSSNPAGAPNAGNNSGCTAPSTEFVALIDPRGREGYLQYPCFDHGTLPDLLNTHGISWAYYTPSAGSIWTGPNAIFHLRFGVSWTHVIIEPTPTQLFSDIAHNQIPAVSWVIPRGQNSDHPGGGTKGGPSWVAAVVNAIGESPLWATTAIFITWDDWGGWYDHVAPPIYNSYEYGFRVPLIVVSPYAKQKYVSHATHDFGSILKFIETNFKLPSLGYADTRADDLSDCFDFTQTPTTFRPVLAPLDATYFLREKSLPTDPDDD